jgi:hypothetical protein
VLTIDPPLGTRAIFVVLVWSDMNKHFEDARYYLGRAAEHAAEGLREELSPVETRVRELIGAEQEPDPSRVETIRSELRELESRAQGKSKEAIASARDQLAKYRGSGDEPVEVEVEAEGDGEAGGDGSATDQGDSEAAEADDRTRTD